VRLQAVDPVRLNEAAAEQAVAEASLADARGALEAAEQTRAGAEAALAEARTRHSEAEARRAKLDAEMRALSEILAVKDGEQWPPMVDALDVPAGLEPALGAVLGEELSSAADPEAARHWRELPPLDPPPPLPGGVACLAGIVQAPPALARALSQIGLAQDEPAGDAAQRSLAPGQVVVSPAGAVWRWDGYTIRAGTPTPAAVRLQQRNRVLVLRTSLAEAEVQAAETGRLLSAAEAGERDVIAAERGLRTSRTDAERRCDVARAAAVQLRAQAEAAASRLAAVESQLARVEPDRAEAEAAVATTRAVQAELPDLGALREVVEQARVALAEARSREAAARAERDALAQEQLVCSARREAIAGERTGWRDRAEDAARRLAEMADRQREAEAEHEALAAAPAQAAARRQAALAALEAAHAAHRQAAEALTHAVAQAAEADRVSRLTGERAAGAREDAVRAEGTAAQAEQAWSGVCERIAERLGAEAVLPEPPADPGVETEEKARRRSERLVRERDEMGPVNLRAEVEAEEVGGQLTALDREREEIGGAIAKLRGSIGHLNHEGRERLTTVFEQVDRNFQALFTRMFGGGRANLALVGSDDPLEAGLEIYAQPPGKKLATLSLLSGGEQALVALSLIFAVFRCNPAPVSVLDEVDAPLDDANVDRFCNLLDDMVRETETRFLVVTHHPLTMARMDQLYGVTMQERGVSRLLSVDLAAAADMAEPARMAAE
jgi:chromosome segregation protein